MRVSRNLLGNLITHNMVQGINKEYIFEKKEEKLKYLEFMIKYSNQHKINIISYCIMDNHAHLLLYTDDGKNLSSYMQEINLRYAIFYNKMHNRVGYVFRNRFQSKTMKTELQVLRCIKYIHMNPVKAQIVKKEKEYQFSSYNSFINEKEQINSKILNSIFNSKENYLEKLINIKYEKEEISLEEYLKQFLKERNITIEEVQTNTTTIKKFISYLVVNEYAFTKVQLAKTLKISRASLYRRLKING